MKPEDAPSEWVEALAKALIEDAQKKGHWWEWPITEWADEDCAIPEDRPDLIGLDGGAFDLRHATAAVAPMIQRRALEEVQDWLKTVLGMCWHEPGNNHSAGFINALGAAQNEVERLLDGLAEQPPAQDPERQPGPEAERPAGDQAGDAEPG